MEVVQNSNAHNKSRFVRIFSMVLVVFFLLLLSRNQPRYERKTIWQRLFLVNLHLHTGPDHRLPGAEVFKRYLSCLNLLVGLAYIRLPYVVVNTGHQIGMQLYFIPTNCMQR
jgi:hypothetical protein